MRRIFVDTIYWIAITNRKDQWHSAARDAGRGLVGRSLVTTDEVIVEVLNAFCRTDPYVRREVIALIRDLHAEPSVTILPRSRQSFLAGLALYEARADKEYSLTDCISMATMRQEGIVEILTHDDHFTQEGFTKLL